MIHPLNINGIKYYPTRTSCISHFEKKPWHKKIISFIASFGTLFAYGIKKIFFNTKRIKKQMDPYTKAPMSNSANKRLVVCLHGLNSNPTQFKKIVDEMHKQDPSEFDIYIPKILKKGNAKLDEMVPPILKDINEWASIGEEKELILVAVSNGGRIGRAIEAELINSGDIGKINRLRFVSIVGACKGSSLATLAKKIHASWILSKNIAEEMPTNSERFKQLEAACEKAKEADKPLRDYTFIASPHDWQVPNYNSTLMDMPDAVVKYAIVPNHGHNSIVDAVAKSVAAIVMRE